ncbi:SDR family NAD(P)-dependent oxidoreductase [Cupriavidus basilensis]
MKHPMSIFDLSGRAAFISGASSGIGLHTARTLAKAGAAVALGARPHSIVWRPLLPNSGQRATRPAPSRLDVTNPSGIASAWQEAESQLGLSVDILFNNAGVIYVERFTSQTHDEVSRIFDTNLKGAFLVAQEAARHMSARGHGSIINIASSSGLRAGGQMSSHGASKAGLIHLTHIMALELAGKGVARQRAGTGQHPD